MTTYRPIQDLLTPEEYLKEEDDTIYEEYESEREGMYDGYV